MKTKFLALIGLACLAVTAQAQFSDNFDTIGAGWVTDRYEPHGFESESFMGDNRLKITIDPSDASQFRPGGLSDIFYNTHGRKHAVSGLDSDWTVSADLYISSDMLTSDVLWRTDVWTRDTNTVENNAWYGIFGAIRNDAANPFSESAANKTNRWRVWDGHVGWIDLGESVTEGWHNLAIKSVGTSAEYYLNGTLVYTDAVASQVGFEGLKDVYLQGYSFGDANNVPSAQYSVYWDNMNAVPEPGTMTLLALGGAALLRRKFKKS